MYAGRRTLAACAVLPATSFQGIIILVVLSVGFLWCDHKLSSRNWALKAKGKIPGRLEAMGILHCLQPAHGFPPRLFASAYAAPGGTSHSSRPPDRHKSQDSKNRVRDLFSQAAALTGVTGQLFSALAPICKPGSMLYKPAPGSQRLQPAAGTAKHDFQRHSQHRHAIVWGWWQTGRSLK